MERRIDKTRLKRIVLIWCIAISIIPSVFASYHLYYYIKGYFGYNYWHEKAELVWKDQATAPRVDPYGLGDHVISEVMLRPPSYYNLEYAIAAKVQNYYEDLWFKHYRPARKFGIIALLPWAIFLGWILGTGMVRWHYRYLYPEADGWMETTVPDTEPEIALIESKENDVAGGNVHRKHSRFFLNYVGIGIAIFMLFSLFVPEIIRGKLARIYYLGVAFWIGVIVYCCSNILRTRR